MAENTATPTGEGVPLLEQLKAVLDGWDGKLIYVQGNEAEWKTLLDLVKPAARNDYDWVVVIEDDKRGGAFEENMMRRCLRDGLNERLWICAYASLEDAIAQVGDDLEL